MNALQPSFGGTISFVGGGNLARALVSGLVKSGFPEAQIVVSNRGREKLAALAKDFGITPADTNVAAAEQADILVIAVKPQDVEDVFKEIKPAVQSKHPLVISLAAGLTADQLDDWLGGNTPIIRTMPNTATLIGKGVTVLYANPLSVPEKEKAESLFKLVGLITWVETEKDLDLMTPFVGSSIAYLYIFVEAMKEAAKKSGINPAIVHQLALQTVYGAAELAVKTGESLPALEAQVATPGGVTEPSLAILRTSGLFESMEAAFKVVADRCGSLLSGKLDKDRGS